jgi:predicted flavoprotein YhiN
MKVIVIGGGASGMTAAIVAKRCGDDVTIIEKNNILGKKLLLTGNGHCNYFNDNMNISNFNSSGDLSKIINDNNIKKAKEYMDSIGIIPRIKDGYYYPLSNI